jgi:hypothetical protein
MGNSFTTRNHHRRCGIEREIAEIWVSGSLTTFGGDHTHTYRESKFHPRSDVANRFIFYNEIVKTNQWSVRKMMMINHIIHKMIYDLEQQQAEFYMHKKKGSAKPNSSK